MIYSREQIRTAKQHGKAAFTFYKSVLIKYKTRLSLTK